VGESGEFYFLASGDRFDLSTRQPFRETYSHEPFEEVISSSSQP
jgi:hypothetical protein